MQEIKCNSKYFVDNIKINNNSHPTYIFHLRSIVLLFCLFSSITFIDYFLCIIRFRFFKCL